MRARALESDRREGRSFFGFTPVRPRAGSK